MPTAEPDPAEDPAPSSSGLTLHRLLRPGAVGVGLVLAIVCGPDFFDALITTLLERQMRYRIVQFFFVTYLLTIVVVPAGLVVSIALGFWARRMGHRRLSARAGKAFLLTMSLFVGIGLCELACRWRLRSQAQLAHLPAIAGAKKIPMEGPRVPGQAPEGNPLRNVSGPYIPPASSQKKTIDVVIIGGSSAKGVSFAPKMSLDRVIAWQLGRAFPNRTVRADNQAESGATLEAAIGFLARLECHPDLLIIYSGHNEFQSRFGWMRKIPYYPIESKLSPPTFAQKAGKWSSTANLLGRTLDRFEASLILAAKMEREPADVPCCTPEEYTTILADYRRRLEGLLDDCDRSGILVMIVVPPSNDGGFDPNRSILPANMRLSERRTFVSRLDGLKRTEKVEPHTAIKGYRGLIAEQPGFAETHFRLARLLENAGEFNEAREEYTRARELDAFPIRCPSPFQEVCRELGSRHRSIVIDAPRLLARACPHGILDDRMFDDVHHPGLNAVTIMARDSLRQLKGRGAFGWPTDMPVASFSLTECIARFKLNQEDWIRICHDSYTYYQLIRSGRRDASWRDSLAARYERAIELLKDGMGPEGTGIPALKINEELKVERPPVQDLHTRPSQASP